MTATPELAAPGAGLPLFERLISRYIVFPYLRSTWSWPRAQNVFRHEVKLIEELYGQLSPSQQTIPTLIDRVTGIEDSSRNWSAAQTLDHLIIVANGMTGMIQKLAAEQTINHVVNTANVKPAAQIAPDILTRFHQEMQDSALVLATIQNTHSKTRHLHPWFGMLDTHGWHTMWALHVRVHRHQMESIVKARRIA